MKTNIRRRPPRLRALGSAVGLAAVLTAAGAAAQPQVNQPAPDCSFALAGQPGRTNLRQLRGKVVYVDFWASWCGPCAISFPFMNRLQQEEHAKGLQIIAVDMDRNPQDAQRFLAAHGATFAVGVGDNDKCARTFGVAGMPTSYLIDRGGLIRQVHAGFREGDATGLRMQIERVMAEPAAAAQ